MDDLRKKELLDIYKDWIHETIGCWECDLHSWDHMVGDSFTIEEWRWITENLNYDITVYDMNDQ